MLDEMKINGLVNVDDMDLWIVILTINEELGNFYALKGQ